MRIRHRLAAMLTAVALLVGSQSNGTAAEYSFAPYGLGAAAFGAGGQHPIWRCQHQCGRPRRRLQQRAKRRKPRIVSHCARAAHSVRCNRRCCAAAADITRRGRLGTWRRRHQSTARLATRRLFTFWEGNSTLASATLHACSARQPVATSWASFGNFHERR